MSLRPLHWLTILAIGLGAMCVFYWGHEARPWVPPRPILPDAAALAPVVVTSPTIMQATFSSIVERPLFVAGRRPLATVVGTEKEVDSTPREAFADVRLAGVLGHGEHGVVILNAGGVNRRVRAGDVFEGWTLAAVDDRTARFTREGVTKDLIMVHVLQVKVVETAQAAPITAGGGAGAAPPVAATPAAGGPTVAERVAARRARREALIRSHAK